MQRNQLTMFSTGPQSPLVVVDNGTVTIQPDGVTKHYKGRHLVINGDKAFVDGKEVVENDSRLVKENTSLKLTEGGSVTISYGSSCFC